MVDVGPKALREAAAVRAEQTRLELERLQTRIDAHHRDTARLQALLHDAWQELATVLVPDLEAATLDRISADLEAPQLAALPVLEALNGARAELDRTIAELRGELESRKAGPDRSAQIRELEAAMAPHAANVEMLEREPTWPELFDLDYDTPRYAVPWWMFRYYRHKRQASALIERLGPHFGATTLAQLRERFIEERSARARLARDWEECKARQAGADNLERGLKLARATRDGIVVRHLERAREQTRELLRVHPPQQLREDLADDPSASAILLRIDGLEAQRRILLDIFQAWIERPRAELVALLNRDEADAARLGREGIARSMPWETFVDTYRDPRPAWDERTRRYDRCRRQVLDFSDDRQSAVDWWQRMLGAEPPLPAELAP